jgi:N-glycosylase/DNA lyase
MDLKVIYNIKKDRIKQRLDDFQRFYSEPVSWFFENDVMELRQVDSNFNQRIFEEMVFCILTANTSAVSGMKAVDNIREILIEGSTTDIYKGLVLAGYRFPNTRANYITETRKIFVNEYNFDFLQIFRKYTKSNHLREFFVCNVKGFGYKEASHFLRNVGIFGLAILDKHILNTLYEKGIIEKVPATLNKQRYLEIEDKFKIFSKQLGISMDELDLLFWSMKNGNIMK